MALPQLTAPLSVSDGGLETSIVYQQGIDLPDFAAFPLLDSEEGRAALQAYYEPYLDLGRRLGLPVVLENPTWRANQDWGARLGYDAARLADVNRRSVEFVRALATSGAAGPVAHVLNGAVGPRGDGYVVGETMSISEAAAYHGLQTRAFAEAGAEMVTAVTMTYVDEAIGLAQAAAVAGLPSVISFTVETDGSLPSGEALGDAISQVDDATDGAPAYYMVNCAHPSHFAEQLTPGAEWLSRVKAIRANASRCSHAELDAATELDRGDVTELAGWYRQLHTILPDLRVVGGCCGTDHEHVTAITEALVLVNR
ncbi:MAG TPA: homocysteine S-methyltransferase family protein [Acidimicrobiales bacterium]|nr:homocysteine S-methyltransferase family protein [Acidimicrobiales bacterium]